MKATLSNIDQKKWQWLSFGVIAFFVLVVYAPSLLHTARADQIMYLAEVAHKNSLYDLTLGSLDLNRHRVFNPGDEALFRPVVYLLLGLEKYFFGYHFIWWQAVGIALHLGVVWFLLRLLLSIHCGWPAVMAAAFYAFLFVNMEMVVWSHINGYMIFAMAICAGMRHFWEILKSTSILPRKYIGLTAWLFVGALTYELAPIMALVMVVILWWQRPGERKWASCLLAVPIIYVILSVLNGYVHPFVVHDDPTGVMVTKGQLVGGVFYAIGVWLYAGLFPFELKWLMAARNMIAPEEVHLLKIYALTAGWSFVALGALAAYAWTCRQIQRSRNAYAMLLVLITGLLVFAMVIAFGRGSQWGVWAVLRVNTYYMYVFWLFSVVGFFVLIDWAKAHRWAKVCLAICLLLLVFANAQKLYVANDVQARDNNHIVILVNVIDELIKEHGNEKDFSFFVDDHYPGNYIYTELRKPSDPPERKYSFIEVLFPQYFDRINPKYKLKVIS